MSDQRKDGISWTDETWNPVRGCSKVSAGCAHCYAESMAARFCGEGLPYHGLIRDKRWTGDVQFVPEMLDAPLRWKRPRRIFVNSMSDLFHESLPFEDIAKVFAVMQLAQHHEFQVLTKRAQRMLEFYHWLESPDGKAAWLKAVVGAPDGGKESWSTQWPFRNVHLGVSCENQAAADERIPYLLQCPAAVRWVSYEPALGGIDFRQLNDGSWYDREGAQCYDALTGHAYYRDGEHGLGGGPKLDWVVCGGESGPHARPMHPDWARSIRDQCRAAGVPFHFKQHGEWVVASEANGVIGSTMPPTGERYTWLGFDGKTQTPSHKGLLDPVYAMARVGKKRAGHLLDGNEYRMYPGDVWP